MSEIQKCPNLVRGGGGGQHFSKMSEIQKCPKGRRGSTLIRTLFQIFSIFYFDASPKEFSVFCMKKSFPVCTLISLGDEKMVLAFLAPTLARSFRLTDQMLDKKIKK